MSALWPNATCGPQKFVGRFRGVADIAEPAAGSGQSVSAPNSDIIAGLAQPLLG